MIPYVERDTRTPFFQELLESSGQSQAENLNLSLVPIEWQEWLKSRNDIREGKYSYYQNMFGTKAEPYVRVGWQKVDRSPRRERDVIFHYLNNSENPGPMPKSTRKDIPLGYQSLINFVTERASGEESSISSSGEQNLAHSIGPWIQSPMDRDCRVSVIIPARLEEKYIRRALETYTHQVDLKGNPINPRLFELNVLSNITVNDSPDKTYEEVLKFKDDHPEITTNVYHATWNPQWKVLGICRRFLIDTVMTRSLQRPLDETIKPLYFQIEDAELTHTHPQVIARVIDGFDKKPYLDSLVGYQDRDPKILKQNDTLFLSRRAGDLIDIFAKWHAKYMRDTNSWLDTPLDQLDKVNYLWNRTATAGWNTAHTAEVLALIGGWNPYITMYEDLDIGVRTSLLRGTWVGNALLPVRGNTDETHARSHSSARRFIEALAQIQDPYHSNDSFFALEGAIHEQTEDEMLEKIDALATISDENKWVLEQQLSQTYTDYLQDLIFRGDREKSTYVMKRTMTWLGFKPDDYELSETGIKISNLSNVHKCLERYRNEK